MGWAPRRRLGFRYFLPSEFYESLLDMVIVPGCRWLDVGGGRDLCPENPQLAQALAARCSTVIAVDPSATVLENRFVHEAVQLPIEEYSSHRTFDVASLRMVAEHVADPRAVADALHTLVRPGGLVVLLTVNAWSPVSLIARVTPFAWHHRIKRIFWGGEPDDTFPVEYRLNTPKAMRGAFGNGQYRERLMAHVDDLSTFGFFRSLGYVELLAWRLCRRLGLRYPENCLLAVYEVVDADTHAGPRPERG